MNKTFVTLIVLVVVVIVGGIFLLDKKEKAPAEDVMVEESDDKVMEDEETSVASGEYALKSEESSVGWIATKTFLDYTDEGTVNLSGGNIVSADGKSTGTITADMTTIVATETAGPFGLEKLEGHLKSDDFFGVETHPEATLEVTNIADGKIFGNLTIKGITQGFSAPVQVVETESGVTISGSAVIDRTLFDVRYGSDSFFDNLGDNTISDDFTLDFNLVFEAVATEDSEVMEEAEV